MKEWKDRYPVLNRIMNAEEVIWLNPKHEAFANIMNQLDLTHEDIRRAEERFDRFQPLIAELFPDTVSQVGEIESAIVQLSHMQTYLSRDYNINLTGNVWLKCDHKLPIAGSIKARGGVYEVLKLTETIALENGLLDEHTDIRTLASEKNKAFFHRYGIVVGSTGNLGLSIGIMGAKIGFNVEVHMSSDAKEWKKEKLRSEGATVVEHEEDFSRAVSEGRKAAAINPELHFVDDEWSYDLFVGYAVAALRLQKQLDDANIRVDEEHPLFVYLPCGVGGGPGGVTFGLKQVFGDAVHCFFAEPTESPAMFLGLMTGLHEKIAVGDFGLSNKTAADGLAVGRPSGVVGKMVEAMVSGVYTVNDQHLYQLLHHLWNEEGIYLEPSALAGFPGPYNLIGTEAGKAYCKKQGIDQQKLANGNHVVWGTGGNMVPPMVQQNDYETAKKR
nr:D-serine ammonia-lyase [Geomicrobium halophilum]